MGAGGSVFRRLTHTLERGQAMMVFALAVPVLLGVIGMAVDLGFVAHQRTQEQNAADAAALAGADILLNGGSTSAVQSAAISYAQNNGYPSGEVTVQIPPQSGPHTGQSGFVAVLIQHKQPTFFVRAVRINSVNVTARAVAGYVPVPENYALVLLDKTMCSSYSQTSGSTLNIVGGGLMDNSSCQPSGSQGGGSTLNASVINYYSSGSWSLSNNSTTSVPPAPTGVQISDPLTSLAAPPLGTPAQGSSGTATNPKLTQIEVTGSGNTTLYPGTYYGGLKITGSGNGTVTFSPGTYIFAGGGSNSGGFDYSGNATISGSGVTFYNTSDPQSSSSSNIPCGGYSITGGGTLNLSAPTSGPYADMLFWQDPACSAQMKYAGSGYTTTGVIYLPSAQLNVSGGGALGALQIIVDSFSYSGSASLTINYADYVQLSKPKVALVE
jgi:Flp pilus assembly protein TadG